jgi:hypothetical protein
VLLVSHFWDHPVFYLPKANKNNKKLETNTPVLCFAKYQIIFVFIRFIDSCLADSHCSQEEKRKKLLQAESIEILQYATLNLFFTG